MPRFDDQVVLISGATRGIGRATACSFAAQGATVIINYLSSETAAHQLVEELESAGARAQAYQADVRDTAAVRQLVDRVLAAHGRIDILVNNAGITRDTLTPVMEDAEWGEVLDVNVGGAFRLARAVARPMLLKKRGRIVNVSSVAGAKGGRGQANYAASKAALEGLTRALAVEFAPKGILVNAVAPGIVLTEMSERVRREGEQEALSKILLQRFASPEEIAKVILFLASDDASYITGAVIPVDGGFKMA